jgi:hypothetical protein
MEIAVGAIVALTVFWLVPAIIGMMIVPLNLKLKGEIVPFKYVFHVCLFWPWYLIK